MDIDPSTNKKSSSALRAILMLDTYEHHQVILTYRILLQIGLPVTVNNLLDRLQNHDICVTMEVDAVDSLSSHRIRRLSFGQWTDLNRPSINADILAGEGFFYSGHADVAVCWFCKRELHVRQSDYDPAVNIGHYNWCIYTCRLNTM